VLVREQEELEKVLKDEFDIDNATLAGRVKAGKVTTAWLAARACATKQNEAEGDCQVRRVPKDLSSSDSAAMRRAFEAQFWELEEGNVPGRTYLEKKLDEVEKGEPRAELLTEVVSMLEDDPDTLRAVWSANHELRAVKVGAKVPMPQGPEELRKRLTLLGTAWLFTAFQQTHKAYLQNMDPQLFQEYINYLLGEHVHGLFAKDAGGSSIAGPSWTLLLNYDQAIRHKAVQLVKKGSTFKAALKAAWEDPLVKERNFTTPLALEAVKRPQSNSEASVWTGPPPPKYRNTDLKGRGKGKNKGKEQGKGGGKSKSPPANCAAKTPDGRPICFRFNKKGEQCNKRCSFAHVCGVCFKDNVPMHKCNHQK